ncbi:MAG TPA: hypothetical protein VM165_24185 [Planctomycetaceae bacterium]|nr:hypothetical protein [Planctomycetaceae bacterium]
MADLRDPRLIYLKGGLFVLTGLLASGLLLVEQPTLWNAFLLAITVWCFCRAYYFAFSVIEHYVDPTFKFAGLGAFVRYLLTRRRGDADLHRGRRL